MEATKGLINKIYEDEAILVVDKPAGLVVNKSNTTRDGTLQDMLQHEYPELFPLPSEDTAATSEEQEDVVPGEDLEKDFISRSGIVHRIDKDTSGILLVAKNVAAFKELLRQFKSREVEKKYVAVVNGEIEEPLIEVDAPIKRHPRNYVKFAVVSEGRESKTLIEKVKTLSREEHAFTLVNVYPKTGRTHQIRVHLTALAHPIVSDEIYCTKNVLEMNKKYFDRMMLHALSLTFTHPISRQRMNLHSELPQEFHL